MTVAGIGYRPEEYAQFDVEWKQRGRLQDELLEDGPEGVVRRGVRVPGPIPYGSTPRPFSDPHPLLLVGGSSKAAARRAARLGLPFFPSAHLPDLEAYYKDRLVEYGTEGWTMMPGPETPLLHIAEDPDRAWAEYGAHFLHEARMYASWQSGEIRSAVKSGATTVAELRAEGVYRILTPDQCVALGLDNLVLHPLAGGMPVDEGWRSLRLFAERVLPGLGE
ncbi:LLM class flavin-dependent oxidoreductase [Streptomyces sp. L7]